MRLRSIICVLALIVGSASGLLAQTLDYNNLQFPGSGSIDPVGNLTVFAQCYEAGLTDATSGQAAGIECWIGVSTANTDPSTWAAGDWTVANFFGESGNNDEYTLDIGNASAPGTYYYASRWRLSGGAFTYGGYSGGGGGTWDGTTNVSGVLTVNNPQMDYNNVQFPANVSIDEGSTADIFAQGFESGVTEAAGAGSGVECWIGLNAADTDPSTWAAGAWLAASFNAQIGNNDEFTAAIGGSETPGTYYYASRWRLNGGDYTYGGYSGSGGGTWDGSTNVSGELTVNAIPPPQLMISQYVETNSGSTPKGIELFNNTGSTIDFSVTGLDVLKGTNGATPSSDFTLNTGTLADGAVMVIGTADIGTYLSSNGLGGVQFHAESFTFNGDDALVIELGGVVQDALGTPGSDPGSAWTGSGVSTANSNIQILCSAIAAGDPDGWTDPSERFETVGGGTDLTGFGVAPSCGSDTEVSFTLGSSSVTEDGLFISVCASIINEDPSNATTVEVALNGSSTATNGTDYDDGAGTPGPISFPITLTFPAGSSADECFDIFISVDDTDIEGDETIILDLQNVAGGNNASIGAQAQHTVTILDNDMAPNFIIINEVDYDQDGSDSEEFIELYNTGASAVDLSDYSIELINGSNGSTYGTIALSSVMLGAGDYYVICLGANANAYCDQSESGSLQNGAPDAIGLIRDGDVVDALSYEGDVAGYVEGTGVVSGDQDRDNRSMSRVPNGTDTDDNDTDFSLICISPGAENLVCPENDDCEDAIDITPSLWGTPGWDTLSVVNATESLTGCLGDADDDIWFSFTAEDASDVIIAHDHDGSADLVVEVFDVCGGTSLGCFENYGAGELERVLPGGLVTGDTYVYRVYDQATNSPATGDIRTQVKTWADGEIRPFYCDNLDYELADVFTPERQDLNELYPFTSVYVSGYSVRWIDPVLMDTAIVTQTGYGSWYFDVADFNPSFNTVYQASASHRVRVRANGELNFYWSDYGPACDMGLGGATETAIRDEFCDNSPGYVLSQLIQADYVPNATAYRFTFDDGVNQYAETNSSYGMFLYEIDELEFGVTYTVTVQALLNGVWSAPGDACTINLISGTPATEVLAAYCPGTYAFPDPNFILAELVYGAEMYQWQFVAASSGEVLTTITAGISLQFHTTDLELETGETYTVSVRARAGGVWGAFGNSCNVTIEPPSIREQDEVSDQLNAFDKSLAQGPTFEVYPNPNEGKEIFVSVRGNDESQSLIEVQILDITGKVVDNQAYPVKGKEVLVRVRPDVDLQTGVYLVKVSSSTGEHTERLVVN